MFAGTHRVCYSSTLPFFTCTKTPSHAPQSELIFGGRGGNGVVYTVRIFPFFFFFFSFLMGLFIFFSVSVNKGRAEGYAKVEAAEIAAER